MKALDRLLLLNISDLLPYVSVVKSLPKKQEESALERIVTKNHKPTKKRQIVKKHPIEDIVKKESPPKHKTITYDAFIPTKNLGYSQIKLSYAQTSTEELLEVEVEKDSKKVYSSFKKKSPAPKEYQVTLTYDPKKQGYHLHYEAPHYKDQIDIARQDFRLALDKSLDIFPESLMGGILGFTYLGSGKIARRADLTGDMAMMVDVHESIHTPDEYETRILTDWILQIQPPKYKK